jgi:low affinity Fe/Cu permease
MANHASTKVAKRNEQKRDFFCIVRDAFRCFAQRASVLLGSAWAFCGAVLVIVVWLVTGPTFHFSDTWQLIINTATTVVTFLMVFLIQNTQNRDAKSMHRKFDDVITGAFKQQRAHETRRHAREIRCEGGNFAIRSNKPA